MPYPCPLLLPLLLMVSGGVLLPRGVMGMEVGVGPPGRYGTPGLSGLTVLIPPGQDSCVYFPVQPGDQWIFYYQVIRGTQSGVDFYILNPAHHFLVLDKRQASGKHRIQMERVGDHTMCFDNFFSFTEEKVVSFHLLLRYRIQESAANRPDNRTAGRSLTSMENSLALLRERLLRCGLYQRVLRYGMVLDHEEQSLNAWRVQFWSAFILLLVPCVSALQVYAVKAQFRGPTIYTGFRVRN
ncbi:transmembrane emp24 domain-containing protein 5-like [Huso huso]|uniref:Transmembrane emp24 domain-containing protein 5-like n=1 Tax=Huso huso TaxID=61971 RepID=A0ABR0YBN6_HUSHU